MRPANAEDNTLGCWPAGLRLIGFYSITGTRNHQMLVMLIWPAGLSKTSRPGTIRTQLRGPRARCGSGTSWSREPIWELQWALKVAASSSADDDTAYRVLHLM